jgi:hypothetical protein
VLDSSVFKSDASGPLPQDAGNGIDQRRFSGGVRAYNRRQFALLDIDLDVGEGL